jgi:hypothetical protein
LRTGNYEFSTLDTNAYRASTPGWILTRSVRAIRVEDPKRGGMLSGVIIITGIAQDVAGGIGNLSSTNISRCRSTSIIYGNLD